MVRHVWRPHPFWSQESRRDVSDGPNPDVLQETRKEAQLETKARELESAQSEVAAVQTALASLRSSERVKQSASASVQEEHQQVSLKAEVGMPSWQAKLNASSAHVRHSAPHASMP